MPSLEISYEAVNPNGSFAPGDPLTGNVTLRLTKETAVQRLYIKAKGDANVKWSEGSGDNRHTYSAHRRYFKLKHFLIPDTAQGETIVPQGSHVYPFSFTIPQGNFPPTFKGLHGRIVYKLEAVLCRAWRLDSTKEVELTLICKSFANFHSLMSPQVGSVHKEMGLFSKGKVNMDVTVDKRAYAPGETAMIVVKVNNASSNEMAPKFSLNQEILYRAHSKTKHQSHVAQKVVGQSIGAQDQAQVQCAFKIPQLLPTVQNCDIISVEYTLKVYLDISFASDPSVKFPVVILSPYVVPAPQPGGFAGPYPAGEFAGPYPTGEFAGPCPMGGFGGPGISDFPPQALPPKAPPLEYPGAPQPAYAATPSTYPRPPAPPMLYPTAPPPHVSGGFNNPMPQQSGPYGSPFSSSSSTPALHPPPSAPAFHPPSPARTPPTRTPPPPFMASPPPPTYSTLPSAPWMNVDFLSQTEEPPPSYSLLFPPTAPENSKN